MQTIENPSEQPEQSYEPRITLTEPLLKAAGVLGYKMMFEMYNHPFTPFLPTHVPSKFVYERWDIEQLAQCIGKGLVTMHPAGNGFQLTVEGRCYMTQDINRKKRAYFKQDQNEDDGDWMVVNLNSFGSSDI